MKQTVRLNSGDHMPVFGLGVWQVADGDEVVGSVTAALDAGYRLIDTARIYGNEEGVGRALRRSTVPRKDIFLTTKLWNDDHGHQEALKAFDASLKRLGQDYIDLYLIHWPGGGQRIESWLALEELYRQGRARSIGVSNYNISHIEELLKHNLTIPAVNQVEFHPFIYQQQKPLLDYCKEKGIVFEAYSPLARGNRIKEPLFKEIADTHGKTPAQVMLRWAVQHGTVIIPKSSNPARIKENMDIFDFELSDADMERINGLSDDNREAWDPTRVE